MSAIDLVVTDLDGTLWDTSEDVHEHTREALAELERRGVPLLVATGRRRASTQDGLARLGLAPPAVLLDGALGLDLATGQRFHRRGYDPDAAVRVLDAFLAEGLEPCVYVDRPDVEVLVGDHPSTSARHLEKLGNLAQRVDDLRAATATEPVLSFGIVSGEPERLDAVMTNVSDVASPRVSRDTMFGGVTMMVPPRDVSKWDGVVAFCSLRGLDPSRVVAIGDGENDLEILANAAVACVISEGCDAALELAHHVLDPPHAGGWAQILAHV